MPEYRGDTLEDVIRATFARERRIRNVEKNFILSKKNQRQCNDLIVKIVSLQSDLKTLQSDALAAAREAESLRRSARRKLTEAALAALTSAASAFRGLAAAAQI